LLLTANPALAGYHPPGVEPVDARMLALVVTPQPLATAARAVHEVRAVVGIALPRSVYLCAGSSTAGFHRISVTCPVGPELPADRGGADVMGLNPCTRFPDDPPETASYSAGEPSLLTRQIISYID